MKVLRIQPAHSAEGEEQPSCWAPPQCSECNDIARRPAQHWTVLAAHAAANEGVRFGMGMDLAPTRVNVVAPGAVTTPLLERLPASGWERWRRQLLTEELGKAEDVAQAYIYSKDRSATGALIDSSDGRLFS
ncbi:hypothetical protein CNMCM7927_006418 [Aspergillus lentulus]|nr:hypothetical protein CNMCM7927_006418 [Aspergillus lentulus]